MRDIFILVLVSAEIITVAVLLGRRISELNLRLMKHTGREVHPDGFDKPHEHGKK